MNSLVTLKLNTDTFKNRAWIHNFKEDKQIVKQPVTVVLSDIQTEVKVHLSLSLVSYKDQLKKKDQQKNNNGSMAQKDKLDQALAMQTIRGLSSSWDHVDSKKKAECHQTYPLK